MGEYGATWAVLEELGLEKEATAMDCRVVRYIAECIGIRAATLAAAGVASLLNKMNRRRVTVGMDGSLYKFHPHFQDRMAAKIRSNKNITPVPNLKFSLEFFFYLFTLHIFGHNILKSADRHL